MLQIKDLKKNDRFIFNDVSYCVQKKYSNDDSPLRAINQKTHEMEEFFHEGLEIKEAK